ncbi:hypothetical protein [Clostridium cochlearium]|uniref:hypothetical protein n=1 Tax=Clostridium cochlearium TaxID=1494 RepID=UPI000B94DF1A|nr:hypothetical protein [Clostridium cochlearium]SNV76771.1 Uncharacterised protein [Clostridium cochlearium]STA92599.1 Uncharacterised protein [Clostridium cochlearium]
MKKFDVALKEYKITIEVLSGLCTGSNDTSYYSSDEYIVQDGKIYFINFNDILQLREKGILKDSELETVYNNICEKNFISDKLKKHLKSLRLLSGYDNKMDIHKFGSIKEISENAISEIRTITGSTIKGIFRHGFEIFNVESVNYKYERYKRLNLYGVNTINDKDYSNYYYTKEEKEKKNLIRCFPKGKLINYRYNIKFNKDKITNYNDIRDIEDSNFKKNIRNIASDTIFRNIIFSDCKETKVDFVIEKIYRWNRKSKKEIIPQYYEMAQKGGLFEGKISCKDIEFKKENLTTISLMYKDKTPIEIALESLRQFYSKVIDLEEQYYIIPRYFDALKEFYKCLREENNKNNQFVCKLGYSGAISKTLLCYDNVNNKDKLLPYTSKYMAQANLPFGWVKVKLEEIKHED